MANFWEKILKNAFVGFASRFFGVARKKQTLHMTHSLLDILESRHIPTNKYLVGT